MKIVNPIYDKAFKYLMQNNRIAKRVLEVIIDQPIEELFLEQQETVVPFEERRFTLFRLDFKAKIKDENGKLQTVLIELQKSKFITDLVRFRNYIGANYMSKSIKKNRENESGLYEQEVYPIIAIYILGYNIAEIPYLAVNTENCVYNSISKEPVNIESDFIDNLTHRAFILQVKRLPEKRKVKLEKFLSLFDQSCVTKEDYILDLKEVPEEFKDMVDLLNAQVYDEEFREQLQAEREINVVFDNQERKYEKEIYKEKQNALREKKRAEKEKKRAEEEKKRAEEEKLRAEQKQKELNAEKQKTDKLIQKFLEMGYTKEQIEKLINNN